MYKRFILACLAGLIIGIPASGETLDPSVGAETDPAQVVDSVNPAIKSNKAFITLTQAIVLALDGNPELAAFSWDIRAADARILQASLRPNPELSVAMEEMRWTPGPAAVTESSSFGAAIGSGLSGARSREQEQGTHSGLSETEFTISVSQLIELGGKRAKRVRLAQRGKDLAQWDYEVVRANVIAQVRAAFIDTLEAQEHLTLQDELVRLADEVLRIISLRVKAGQVSPLEESRAEITLSTAQVGREYAAREFDSARARLAAVWGAMRADFSRAAGQLDEIQPIPSLELLRQEIKNNPDISRWTSELAFREADFQSERAMRIPNPTLSLGLRSTGTPSNRASGYTFGSGGDFESSNSRTSFDESRDNSIVLEFSIPLPLFNRNQGTIQEAKHRISRTHEERRSAEVNVTALLASAYYDLSGRRAEVETLSGSIIPRATENFEKTQRGYTQGKFSYLEVLDSQRTLFDAKTAYLTALAGYQKAVARIERLTGQALVEPGTGTKPEIKENENVE